MASVCVCVCEGIFPMHNSNIWTLLECGMQMNFHRLLHAAIRFQLSSHVKIKATRTKAGAANTNKWCINNLLAKCNGLQSIPNVDAIERIAHTHTCISVAKFKFIAHRCTRQIQNCQLISINEMDFVVDAGCRPFPFVGRPSFMKYMLRPRPAPERIKSNSNKWRAENNNNE